MKAYTDINQSKKLAEILSIESADMRYAPFGDIHPWFWDGHLLEKGAIPCWSLAALFERVLPLEAEIHKQTDGHKMYYYVEIYTKEICMKLKRMNKPEICLSSERHENLVDACVEMILKLYKEKIL